jgi:hypothetical protein
MSEAEHYQQQAREAMEAKREERRRAREYVLGEYQRHGLNEAERDEILAALGISTDVDIDNLDFGVAQRIPTGGLTRNAVKAVMPRTPPSRASSL